MTIPTTVVQDYLYNEDGTPAVGGSVTAQLDLWELDTTQGYVQPQKVTTTCDNTGFWSMELFPQASGSTASQYTFTLQTATQLLTVNAVVPAEGPVYLRNIASQPPIGANGAIAIPDAPSDGNIYGRKDAAWVEVSGGSGSVTSVGITPGSSKITVSGSPITSSGDITVDVDETQLTIPASQTTGFATVAVSGSYTDLSNKPTIPSGTVTSVGITAGSNKLTVSGSPVTSSGSITVDVDTANIDLPAAQITGLATVATSGSYTDLSNKPTIPGVATTSVAGIVKPDGTTIDVAVDGTISIPAPINIAGLSSDTTLVIGQEAYIDITSATSVPLYIACGDKQQYDLTFECPNSSPTTPTDVLLLPNNTSYANFFYQTHGIAIGSSSVTASSSYRSGMVLGVYIPTKVIVRIQTSTAYKTLEGIAIVNNSSVLGVQTQFSAWMATASTQPTLDTTTVWTSLGTVTFASACSGRITVKRVA